MTPDNSKQDWCQDLVDIAAVSIASRGQLLPPDGEYLPPHLWEALRQRLQQNYRKATGERNAVLTIEDRPMTPDDSKEDGR